MEASQTKEGERTEIGAVKDITTKEARKGLESCQISKIRIDYFEIRCIVQVIGRCLKNGVEIERTHA